MKAGWRHLISFGVLIIYLIHLITGIAFGNNTDYRFSILYGLFVLAVIMFDVYKSKKTPSNDNLQ